MFGLRNGRRGAHPVAVPEPITPMPPSAAVLARQRELGRKARSPLRMWLASGGWVAIAAPIAIIALAAITVGLSRTGELLIGVASPADGDGQWWQITLSWLVGVIGWLGVPALVGAVVGYFVTVRLGSYRARSRDDIINGDGVEHE
jgi:anti-sigma factor RsiW